MKKLLFVQRVTEGHWVGDGFPVRTIFSYDDIAEKLSPFLLLDYGGPRTFPPTDKKLGVGEHPHRGFETVTICFEGEVAHRDSSGGGGLIGPGDVQWMTAGSGVVHEEFHGPNFAKRGGPYEMIQLWVNLPKKDKLTKPRYQPLTKDSIPVVALPNEAGSVRVIAGEYDGHKGPALTFSPIALWDLRLRAGARVEFRVGDGWTTALFVRKGSLAVPREGKPDETIAEAELAVMEREGDTLSFKAREDTTAMLLSGSPLNEPIVGYGPFVMSTEDEIRQAIHDYQSGKMGHLK